MAKMSVLDFKDKQIQSMECLAWPVIVHQLSSGTDLVKLLRQYKFKVRISDSVIPGSLIFPLSGVAFIVVPLSHAMSTDLETRQLHLTSELINRLDKFHQTHRNCYCLCQAPLHGHMERQGFSLIQKRYMFTRLKLLPVHNANEAMHTMITIAKALCKPTKDVLDARLEQLLSEHEARDYTSAALKHLGLNSHQINILEDSIGSLVSLSSATQEELLNYLDMDAASKVYNFFKHCE